MESAVPAEASGLHQHWAEVKINGIRNTRAGEGPPGAKLPPTEAGDPLPAGGDVLIAFP